MEKEKLTYNELKSILQKLYKNNKIDEMIGMLFVAINSITRKNDVTEDWAGVEYPHLTLKEILEKIGLCEKTDENGNFVIDKNNKILNYKVELLEDDGMGYGAINGYATDAYEENDDNVIKIWF